MNPIALLCLFKLILTVSSAMIFIPGIPVDQDNLFKLQVASNFLENDLNSNFGKPSQSNFQTYAYSYMTNFFFYSCRCLFHVFFTFTPLFLCLFYLYFSVFHVSVSFIQLFTGPYLPLFLSVPFSLSLTTHFHLFPLNPFLSFFRAHFLFFSVRLIFRFVPISTNKIIIIF